MNFNSENYYSGNPISTALLLAAETDIPIFPLAKNSLRCLTPINEKSTLERLVIITRYEKEWTL